MTPEQFYFWLNGFAEATDAAPPGAEGWQKVMNKLAEVKIFTPMPRSSPCGGCNEQKT